ncbi:hypothetical protein [Cyanobacterium sp. Dongsha4]|uniref:hypothetical protein n=1 Tax=Cyanobacterium sp. DS4 TaxID=2878255 RepID=UPI002E809C9F|nr:hypothetical protein [Cyanobacterium sp. Dongsha4]WVL01463.1 hypothetical protein Dongsha4_04530 [Cyanobacterium sp. Dongsha4]
MSIELAIEEKTDKPWWNRPLIGDKPLVDYLFKQYSRTHICPEIISLHDYHLEKLESISVTLKALFNQKFTYSDFLIYARLEGYFQKYCQTKKHYFLIGKEFFRIILDNLDNLKSIIKIETKYQNPLLLIFYDSVYQLIKENHHKLIFQEKLIKLHYGFKDQLKETKERKIIDNYLACFISISEVENLLYFFDLLRVNNLTNWDHFTRISNFIEETKIGMIEDIKPFLLFTKSEQEFLIEIANKIIKIKEDDESKLVNIAKIFQYIALVDKYEHLYSQFQLFLRCLSKWEKIYYDIVNLRKNYPIHQFIIPPSFKVKLPGFEIYKSYHDYLDSSCLTRLIY